MFIFYIVGLLLSVLIIQDMMRRPMRNGSKWVALIVMILVAMLPVLNFIVPVVYILSRISDGFK